MDALETRISKRLYRTHRAVVISSSNRREMNTPLVGYDREPYTSYKEYDLYAKDTPAGLRIAIVNRNSEKVEREDLSVGKAFEFVLSDFNNKEAK